MALFITTATSSSHTNWIRHASRIPLCLRVCTFLLLYGFYARLAYRRTGVHSEQTRVARLSREGACRSRAGFERESNVASGLKVILGSVGQTGTTSVAQALRDFGLKTYHIEEKNSLGLPLMWADLNATVAARVASRCGIEALSLEPGLDSLYVLLQASPGVRVVMTWRPFRGWLRSAAGNDVGRFGIPRFWWGRDRRFNWIKMHMMSGVLIVPWLDLWDALTGQFSRFAADGPQFAGRGQCSTLAYLFNHISMGYNHPRNRVFTRGTYKLLGSEEAYLMHQDEMRQLVPSERLLEFDVARHGWADLARFIGVPVPEASHQFPHPRNRDSWTNDQLYDNQPHVFWKSVAVWLAAHAANLALLHVLVARTVSVARSLRKAGPLELRLVFEATALVAVLAVVGLRLERVIYGGRPYPHPPLVDA